MAGLRDYRDKVAIVTGASSGIGAEMARTLAGRGMRVALVARRRERLAEVARSIEDGGGRPLIVSCDVGDRGEVDRALATVLSAWGAVDLLVNNAGTGRHILFADHDLDDIERMMRTNLFGTVYFLRAVLPTMRARGAGWIVNLSSLAGKIGQPDEAVYSATKFAVSGLSQALVHELGPLGIHVLSVHPVLVRTPMFTDEVMARMPKRVRNSLIEPAELCAGILTALERGQTDVVLPRRYGWVCALATLFPGWMGRKIGRVKMDAIEEN
jgi:short-subunit dehydrogenase